MRVKINPGQREKERKIPSNKEMSTNDWKMGGTNEKAAISYSKSFKGSCPEILDSKEG